MLRYNINTGVRKIKTKTAIVASTIVLGLGGATFGLALPFAAHAAPNGGTDHFGPFASSSVDHGCGVFWANDTFDRYFTVHSNGNSTFQVREELKNGSFVTLGSASPSSACPGDQHHGTTLQSGIKGNMQAYLMGTVTSSSYNPDGCTESSADCTSVDGFLTAVFGTSGPSTFTCDLGYAGCDFNFEYNSNDSSLQYHHWQDKSDPATVGEQFVGDIANE